MKSHDHQEHDPEEHELEWSELWHVSSVPLCLPGAGIQAV